MIDRIILLNKKTNNSKLLITIIIASLLLITISIYHIKTYDVTSTYGYIECEEECFINISLPYNKVESLNNDTILKIENDTYNIDNYYYEDITYINEIPYQNIKIKTDIKDNKIINIKLLNNKQRIIKKLYEIIKEG